MYNLNLNSLYSTYNLNLNSLYSLTWEVNDFQFWFWLENHTFLLTQKFHFIFSFFIFLLSNFPPLDLPIGHYLIFLFHLWCYNRNAVDWLKQLKSIFSHFLRLKVKYKMSGGLVLLNSLSLACRWPPSHYVFRWPLFWVHTSSSFSKETSPTALGPTLKISFNLNCLLKGLISKYSYTEG